MCWLCCPVLCDSSGYIITSSVLKYVAGPFTLPSQCMVKTVAWRNIFSPTLYRTSPDPFPTLSNTSFMYTHYPAHPLADIQVDHSCNNSSEACKAQ